MPDEKWEFDARRKALVEHVLMPGESLAWHSRKTEEFENRRVRKVLRRLDYSVTFVVFEGDTDKVITVGTYNLINSVTLNDALCEVAISARKLTETCNKRLGDVRERGAWHDLDTALKTLQKVK